MDADRFYQFRVRLLKDKATGQIVAEVPTLDISDYGTDSQKALRRLKEMVAFHLECLASEGKPVPLEKKNGEGFYLKVRCPTGVA